MNIKKFIISRHEEDISWLKNFNFYYSIIQSKAGHEATMLEYIYESYDNLPDIVGFIQSYPFDHCKEEIFYKLIKNDYFTPLEYYGMIPSNGWEQRTEDGGFKEINNSWYIPAHFESKGFTCKYESYDAFMNNYFKDYQHIDWLRFSPGTQFIVPKENILYYSKDFWKRLFEELPNYGMTESFIIERAMYYIFTNKFEER